ncbi:CehA/McbA family metallohydrolase [Streptomyces sp. MS1.HAVA.3]|uniref:CehA/McbA family metallohydrolase n=1 Tax=Streptomyces caledonius TaxID=3134107 RepID=A0ABU8UFE0_9ACTN
MHSDGKRTVDEIVAAARQEGLHFIATSDHNTSSTGVTWHGNVPTDLLVINAEEVTTRHGHWLAVGLPQGEWVDWRYGPANQGAFEGHARRVHSLGGLTIAAHPLTPAPGSFWEFGLDRVDALEVWNGPWTLDDAANIAAWHVMLCLGKRVAAVGDGDAHSHGDAVGRPHNVVYASGLSTPAVLDALRLGRSYAVESAAVTLDFTARAGGAVAGPGEELPLSFFDAVDVTLNVTGAPDSIATLYTEWGIMAATCIDGSGRGQLRWRGWARPPCSPGPRCAGPSPPPPRWTNWWPSPTRCGSTPHNCPRTTSSSARSSTPSAAATGRGAACARCRAPPSAPLRSRGSRAPWPACRTAPWWCWASRPTTVCG